ncbi:MAG: homocitrate synthase [Lachnospiraceae bacterium]|jgi:homocitrate synthase NifV|nr:homocitrate synthase [Lachnospiraceae bacterium]
MKPKRYILDSSLRDGEQMPGVCFTREQKLKIAAILDDNGVHQIEAGVPATSKQEKENIIKIIENRKHAIISVWGRMSVSDIEHAIDCRPDIIHISVPVSYPHIYVKLRKNKEWVITELYACLGLIDKCKIALSVGFEDAFRSEPAFMKTVANILLDFGVKRIRLSDTVGVAMPTRVRNVLSEFSEGLTGKCELGFHAHNDLGLAVANTVEAAKCGCLYADVTVGGIGERAGNCDLAQLVSSSSNIFDWGISTQTAIKIQDEIFGLTALKI